MPTAEFKALQHVPFLPEDAPSLFEIVERDIAENGGSKQTLRSMSTEMGLLFKAQIKLRKQSYLLYFRTFVNAFPELMADVSAQIERESS